MVKRPQYLIYIGQTSTITHLYKGQTSTISHIGQTSTISHIIYVKHPQYNEFAPVDQLFHNGMWRNCVEIASQFTMWYRLCRKDVCYDSHLLNRGRVESEVIEEIGFAATTISIIIMFLSVKPAIYLLLNYRSWQTTTAQPSATDKYRFTLNGSLLNGLPRSFSGWYL